MRGREEAARLTPRRRLLEATKAVAGAEGYAAATVTRVSERAGLSRVTFYEHFGSREECFRAACQEESETFLRALGGARETGGGAVRGLLRQVEAAPVAARLVLLEALAGPFSTCRDHDLLVDCVGSLLAAAAAPAGEGDAFGLPPRVLAASLLEVAADRVLYGRTAELGGLGAALTTWVESYRVAGEPWPVEDWARLEAAMRVTGPALTPAAAAPETGRLERILDATMRVTAREGYLGASVAGIAAAAGVPRNAVYKQLGGKAGAFRAVQVANLQRMIATCAAAFSLGAGWPEQVWLGLEALHLYVARRPEEAQLALVEVFAAGEEALRLAHDSRAAFALFLEGGYRLPSAVGLPLVCSEAIGAAIHYLLRRCLAAGRGRRALELLPQSAYVALAPFMGAREARAFVELRVREAGRGGRRGRRGRPARPGPARSELLVDLV